MRSDPNLKDLSEQQRLDRVEFVVGNTVFVMLHELGHVAIGDMHLPVLGREEDAADDFAALTLINIGTQFSQNVVANAAKGWFFNGKRDQQTGSKPAFYDEHSLSEQRAYQFICLMVGADPVKFKSLADEAGMPPERQTSCKEDYTKASWSWGEVLKPYRRAPDDPETKIDTSYEEAKPPLETIGRSFQTIRLLETAAAGARKEYRWPQPFALTMRTCGRPGAAWDDKTRILRICYELPFDFAQLYRAFVPPTPVAKAAQATAPVRGKRTVKAAR